MARICFVSNEINPVVPGGAGFLIKTLAKHLLIEGHTVIFLLDIPALNFKQLKDTFKALFTYSENCRAYHIDSLCSSIEHHETDFLSRYAWEAYRYDYACRQVYTLEKPDLIEFVDFCGPAIYALTSKLTGISYQDTHICIRMHGPIEIIDRFARVKPLDFDRYTIHALESYSFKLAETVLYQTPSIIQEYYFSEVASWFGQKHLSPPVIKGFPTRHHSEQEANIILFFGRIFAEKGVDLLVDAAVYILSEDSNSPLEFHFVGASAKETPDNDSSSYQEYLLHRVPERFRERFVFTGFLDKDLIVELLPKVKFAVFPSQYETFCIAAHELRLSGIPLILSSIPAFRDAFQEDEALFFDGSLTDLIKQIKVLDKDDQKREQLSTKEAPYIDCLSEFYNSLPETSWIKMGSAIEKKISLLICILCAEGDEENYNKTLSSLRNLKTEPVINIVKLQRIASQEATKHSIFWLFGDYLTCTNQNGDQLNMYDLSTQEALLVLLAGDEVDPTFITYGLNILARQAQISFVGCWKWIKGKKGKWLDTHQFPQMLELAPFEALSPFSRYIMRTTPKRLLIDLFDYNAGVLAEIDYLWRLDIPETAGVQIPIPFIKQNAEETPDITASAELSYIIMKDHNPSHSKRLSHYLAMLTGKYPTTRLPLQTEWARKSGLRPIASQPSASSFIVRQNWRTRLAKRLGRGGPTSQRMLSILRWIQRIWSYIIT